MYDVLQENSGLGGRFGGGRPPLRLWNEMPQFVGPRIPHGIVAGRYFDFSSLEVINRYTQYGL